MLQTDMLEHDHDDGHSHDHDHDHDHDHETREENPTDEMMSRIAIGRVPNTSTEAVTVSPFPSPISDPF